MIITFVTFFDDFAAKKGTITFFSGFVVTFFYGGDVVTKVMAKGCRRFFFNPFGLVH
jgi:hypothetical protein